MALSYASGETLLDVNDIMHAATLGDTEVLQKLNSTGERALAPTFSPVGLGNPLLVEIISIYTGDAPRNFLGGKPDLLVVSGVKGVQTFDVAARAVNLLEENIKPKSYVKPSAFSAGSPIVYYTDCLDNTTTFCSFELVVDSLRKDTIDSVAKLFATTASLPIFVPANLYLLAGAVLINLVGELANSFESRPFLSDNIDLRFLTSGLKQSFAGHYIVYNDEDRNEFKNYKIGVHDDGFGNLTLALLHKQSGEEYRGAAPYILVNIDGKNRPDLEGYTPKLATAAMLEQFYGKKNRSGQFVNALESALTLYNDFNYRKKAEQLLVKIQDLPVGSSEFALTKMLFDAYVNNIRNELFRAQLEGAI
ncbi:MAG: hypothetical protein ACK4TA_25180 [Saprospiraceae bacterium]